ncbi:MAG: ArnT family glycosyltransferase, partial [Paracoccaceae bacterium]
IAKTDAALLACILLAQAALVRLWLQGPVHRGWIFAFWLAMAVAVLIKGPIGPMVPALTVGALILWDRRLTWLRPLLSPAPILCALIVVLPWFVAISLRSDGAFWQASVGDDLLAKVASGQEGKGAPPGSYLAMLFFAFWPATALLVLSAPRIWAARTERATAFLIAWAVPVWLVYEAVPTKLFHYTLPVFPALALLSLGHLPAAVRQAPGWLKLVAALAMLPGLGVAAGVIYAAEATQGTAAAIWFLSFGLAMALVALAVAWRKLARSDATALVLACAAAGTVLHASLFPALARIPMLWPTERAMAIAEGIAASQGCTGPKLTSWGFTEPSVVWKGGRDTRLFPADAPLDAVVRPARCEVVIWQNGTAPSPPPTGCELAGTVEGFAIGAGRTVTLQVLDCRGSP